MFLLKARFEDKIEFEKEISDGAGEVKIPRLLIQPLVKMRFITGLKSARKEDIAKRLLKRYTCYCYGFRPGHDGTELSALNRMLSMDNDSYFKMLGSKHAKA